MITDAIATVGYIAPRVLSRYVYIGGHRLTTVPALLEMVLQFPRQHFRISYCQSPGEGSS
jgi:hypothetical protein